MPKNACHKKQKERKKQNRSQSAIKTIESKRLHLAVIESNCAYITVHSIDVLFFVIINCPT